MTFGELVATLKLRGWQVAVDVGRQAVGRGVHITDGNGRTEKNLSRDSNVVLLHPWIFEIGGEPKSPHGTGGACRKRAQHVRKCGSERIDPARSVIAPCLDIRCAIKAASNEEQIENARRRRVPRAPRLDNLTS